MHKKEVYAFSLMYKGIEVEGTVTDYYNVQCNSAPLVLFDKIEGVLTEEELEEIEDHISENI
jgi:hypothetical protein